MANHCYNQIEITGELSEIKALKQWLREVISDDFIDFSKIRTIEDLKQNFDFGTRWFYVLEFNTKENDIIFLNSETAWSPALALFELITDKFQGLKVNYYYEEMGCDFAGRAIIQQGQTEDDCDNYWNFKFKDYYSGAAEEVLENELSCFETVDEFKQHEIFHLLKSDHKIEALKRF